MRVQKLFRFPGSTTHCVMKGEDGNYYEFRNTPARRVSEADLNPVPYYQERGRRAEDAPNYLYQIYGLTRAEQEK